jgi:hypothetical protein
MSSNMRALEMNAEGYRLWNEKLQPILKGELGGH